MYTEFFGLKEPPFNSTLDPRFFYRSPQHEEALASLVYAVQERKGLVLVTGDVGSGKTLLGHLLVKQLGKNAEAVRLNVTCLQGADLLQGICREFQVSLDASYNTMEILASLEDFLLTQHSKDRTTVLVVDEAHTLSDRDLEHLRLISNLEVADGKLLQIVLLGQQALNRLLQKAATRPLQQRIFRNFHLACLSRDQTESYIESRLREAGREDSRIFTDEALDLIHQYANGVPRLINNLCDNLLLSAYSEENYVVDGPRVSAVIEEMMNSPSSVSTGVSSGEPDEVDTAISEITSQYVQSLESQLQELASTSTETDQRIREMHRLSTRLQAQELKFSEHQLTIDNKLRDLHRLTVGLQEQEQSLGQREKTLAERHHVLQALLERLESQEQRVAEREAKLAQQLHDLERITGSQVALDQELSQSKRAINRKWQETRELVAQFEAKQSARNKRLKFVEDSLRRFSKQEADLHEARDAGQQTISDLKSTRQQAQDAIDHLRQLTERASLLLQQPTTVMDRASKQMEQVERMSEIVHRTSESLQTTVADAVRNSKKISTEGKQLCERLEEIEDDAVSSMKDLEQRAGKTHKLRDVLREIYDRSLSQVVELKSVVKEAESAMARLPKQLEQLRENVSHPTRLMQELRSVGSVAERNLHDGQIHLAELRAMVEKADKARHSIEALVNATRRVAENRRAQPAGREGHVRPSGPPSRPVEPLTSKIESLAEAVRKTRGLLNAPGSATQPS